MGREASVTLADDSRNFAKLQVAVGLVCIAVLVLEYAGQLGLRPTAQPFGQLGEATSYHSLRYDLVGFWLPGGLLVVFSVGLRRALGAIWLSAGALVVWTVLGMWPCLLGLLPNSPDTFADATGATGGSGPIPVERELRCFPRRRCTAHETATRASSLLSRLRRADGGVGLLAHS